MEFKKTRWSCSLNSVHKTLPGSSGVGRMVGLILSTGWPQHRENRIWFSLFPGRENTGNFVVTWGKNMRHRENIFDCIYYCKKNVSLQIFSNFFSLASLCILSSFSWLIVSDTIFTSIFTLLLLSISHCLQISTKLILAVLKTNWNSVIWKVYIQEFFKCNRHFNKKSRKCALVCRI